MATGQLIVFRDCSSPQGRSRVIDALADVWTEQGQSVLVMNFDGTPRTQSENWIVPYLTLPPVMLRNSLIDTPGRPARRQEAHFQDVSHLATLLNFCRNAFDRLLIAAPQDLSPTDLGILDQAELVLWTAEPAAKSVERFDEGLKQLSSRHYPLALSQVVLYDVEPEQISSGLIPAWPGVPPIAFLPKDAAPGLRLREAAQRLTALLREDPTLFVRRPADSRMASGTPETDAVEKLKSRVQPELLRALEHRGESPAKSSEAALAQKTIEACLAQDALPEVSREQRSEIYERLMEDVLGLGPIEPLLKDPSVSEVMVNGKGIVYVERKGKLQRTEASFASDAQLRTVIDRIVAPIGRRVDESMPLCDARLADGSRVNIVLPPLALDGPTITIRKFMTRKLQLEDLIGLGSMNAAMAAFLRQCVMARRNIVVSGGTGSGKTTLLNALSSVIPEDERIVTIEDAAELRLQKPHVVRLESRPANAEGEGAIPIRRLVINALRMRPDRIVVGECRGGEALDMLQAMNTGHDGSLTTVHANTPRDALGRLETLVLMAGMDLPVRVVREQIRSAVHLIVQQARLMDGSRKVTSITEITGMEGDTLVSQEIYRYHQGQFEATGIVPTLSRTSRMEAVA